jgi:Histidine kinase
MRPLSEGNRLQRWYAAWAAPHYRRMPCEARESAELLDRFLYSRRGLAVWIGLLCAVGGSAAGLLSAGMPWGFALPAAVLFWTAIGIIVLTAWLTPSAVSVRRSLLKLSIGGVFGISISLLGFTVGHVVKRGELDPVVLAQSLWSQLVVLMPAVLGVIVGMDLLMWGVAHVRRGIMQQQLERSTLEREAAEARLRLLQGQIQPHFIFNTLSALQHWVDTADARAPALLRSLTGFLRGSTELLARDDVSLGDEARLLGHYLAIMQARLGPRLRFAIEIAPVLAAKTLPPGLLLTLVENAVEHGIAPALTGGEVRVSATQQASGWQLCVSDDGAGLPAAWHEGVGLANCRQRLLHRFGTRATLQLQRRQPGTLACLLIEDSAA